MRRCPPEQMLVDFRTGDLISDDQSDLETHISNCTKCQARLHRIDSTGAQLGQQNVDANSLEMPAETLELNGRTHSGMDETKLHRPENWPIADPAAIREIAGYRITGKLGEGGMGTGVARGAARHKA